MKKNNKKEKGAALINVMLIVLLAVAIGLPLLYLVVVNFMFRMFDNNLRSISYRNEIGMDNVYAIVQEIVIEETNLAKGKAREVVDAKVKAEQDAYKEWFSEGGEQLLDEINKNQGALAEIDSNYDISLDLDGDGLISGNDGSICKNNNKAKLKKILYEYEVITQEEYDNASFDTSTAFKYVDSEDGSILTQAVKDAYNTYFKDYYKKSMDGIVSDLDGDGIEDNDTVSLAMELKNRAMSTPYNMKEIIDEAIIEEQYAIVTNTEKYKYIPYDNGDGTSKDETSISVRIDYRGKSEATNKYVNSYVSATFTIAVPEFDSASSLNQTTVQISNPLLDKTLVIGNAIELAADKNLSITGSSTVNGENVAVGTATVNAGMSSNIDITGKFVVNGDINLAGGTSKKRNTFKVEGDTLCNEIKLLGENTDTDISGTLYLADDMEFNVNNANMNIGTLMGFSEISDQNVANQVEVSSAIIFNNEKNIDLSTIKLDIGQAYLAGVGVIGDVGYRTGESTAVMGNYRVYQGLMREEVLSEQDKIYSSGNMIFANYGGISLVKNFVGNEEIESNGDMVVKHKTNYFLTSYNNRNTPGAFLATIPQAKELTNMKVGEWKLSTGAYYDSNNNRWQPAIGDDTAFGTIFNAEKDYIKYTKYFGYGEGNKYKLINGNIPTVVGENGWINSTNLEAAANEYSTFNESDEVVVLVSQGDLTLTDSINNKEGIIIAAGDIRIEGNDDITFKGTIICGGKLIVNNNFTLINDSIAITKILESAISASEEEKALFNLFRDDTSGNLYTYSTIDTQIASINMNELIKISDWNKSKFDI